MGGALFICERAHYTAIMIKRISGKMHLILSPHPAGRKSAITPELCVKQKKKTRFDFFFFILTQFRLSSWLVMRQLHVQHAWVSLSYTLSCNVTRCIWILPRYRNNNWTGFLLSILIWVTKETAVSPEENHFWDVWAIDGLERFHHKTFDSLELSVARSNLHLCSSAMLSRGGKAPSAP